jgi:hypothetical protein
MPGDFDFHDLRPEVRALALQEVEADLRDNVLYLSKRFNDVGRRIYPELLKTALQHHDEAWLAEELKSRNAFNATEVAAGSQKAVRRDAHVLFAQSEFNRYYVRALCRLSIESPSHRLRIYRARESAVERPESQVKIGQYVEPEKVLEDLRGHIGASPQFGLPEVNSGLSLEVVMQENV